jgi:WhiB family redox-sensing transcriptional regulator
MPDWRHGARCTEYDPELFWPKSDTSSEGIAQIARAKKVCEKCPVLEECRAWAMDLGPKLHGGVFGGLTEDERASIRRREARARAGKPVRQPLPPEGRCLAAPTQDLVVLLLDGGVPGQTWSVQELATAWRVSDDNVRDLRERKYQTTPITTAATVARWYEREVAEPARLRRGAQLARLLA